MLHGSHEHTVDAKGRIALPIRFREELVKSYDDDRVVVTIHLTDPCLVLYPLAEWKTFEERIANLPQFDHTLSILRRLFVGRAHDCALDKQGRLLLPPELRRDAGIERDAIWTGEARFAELWSKANYEENVASVRKQVIAGELPDVVSKLADLGL